MASAPGLSCTVLQLPYAKPAAGAQAASSIISCHQVIRPLLLPAGSTGRPSGAWSQDSPASPWSPWRCSSMPGCRIQALAETIGWADQAGPSMQQCLQNGTYWRRGFLPSKTASKGCSGAAFRWMAKKHEERLRTACIRSLSWFLG